MLMKNKSEGRVKYRINSPLLRTFDKLKNSLPDFWFIIQGQMNGWSGMLEEKGTNKRGPFTQKICLQ